MRYANHCDRVDVAFLRFSFPRKFGTAIFQQISKIDSRITNSRSIGDFSAGVKRFTNILHSAKTRDKCHLHGSGLVSSSGPQASAARSRVA